jgi:nitroreductase
MFTQPITQIIPQRFSCRTYSNRPIDEAVQQRLLDAVRSSEIGPLGTQTRFVLIASSDDDSKILRGLGTYGFIKNAAGFMVGATQDQKLNLLDFGYLMEKTILQATDFGLGTCWLGGTFTRSKFAKKINLEKDEIIPCVVSIGYIADKPRRIDQTIRTTARSDKRFPWEKLFYDGDFSIPLTEEEASDFAIPIEMVRKAPSASNKQPWRIIKTSDNFHFYLRRTPGYRTNRYAKTLKFADLQMVDMGIAMCHFELTAKEMGLAGTWTIDEPGIKKPEEISGYVVSWAQAG